MLKWRPTCGLVKSNQSQNNSKVITKKHTTLQTIGVRLASNLKWKLFHGLLNFEVTSNKNFEFGKAMSILNIMITVHISKSLNQILKYYLFSVLIRTENIAKIFKNKKKMAEVAPNVRVDKMYIFYNYFKPRSNRFQRNLKEAQGSSNHWVSVRIQHKIGVIGYSFFKWRPTKTLNIKTQWITLKPWLWFPFQTVYKFDILSFHSVNTLRKYY